MTSTIERRPSGRARAASLPELEVIKIIGFVMVIACHFWVQHALPALFDLPARVPGLDIDASTPARIDWAAWFPPFAEHPVAYSAFNLLFGFGYQGVGVFFILTGFGLTLSALQKPRFEPWGYVIGRFERVYLPYLFLLLIFTTFNFWHGGRPLLDLRAFVLMDTGIPYAWFLFPLLQFYVAFPFLFLAVRADHLTPRTLLAGAIALNFIWAFVVLFGAYNFLPSLAIPGACAPKGLLCFRIAEPVFGMWLAYVFHSQRARFDTWFQPRRWPRFAGIYATGCLLSLAETNFTLLGRIVPFGQSITNLLVSVGLFGLLLILARRVAGITSRMQPLARYGFEFYLLQAIPLAGVAWLLPRLALSPLQLLGVLGALLAVNLGLAVAVHHATQWTLRHTYYRMKAWSARANAPQSPRATSNSNPPIAPAATPLG